MTNQIEETKEEKKTEKLTQGILQEIIRDKTDEENNLLEDQTNLIKHSRMNVGYIITTSGLTAKWIQQTLVTTGKTMTDDEVEGKNNDIIGECNLPNLRQAKNLQVKHQDEGRKITESAETSPSLPVHPEALTSPSWLNANHSNTKL